MYILPIFKNTFHSFQEKAKPSLSFLQNKVSQVALIIFGIALAAGAAIFSFRYFFKAKKEKKEIPLKNEKSDSSTQQKQDPIKNKQNPTQQKQNSTQKFNAEEVRKDYQERVAKNLTVTNDSRIEEAKKQGTNLSVLVLNSSEIHDKELIDLFKACPNIKNLDLSSCKKLTGDFLEELPVSLESMNLSNIDLKITGSFDFDHLINLKKLHLCKCKGLENFLKNTRLPNELEFLDLRNNDSLKGDDLSDLPKNLNHLNLSLCNGLDSINLNYLKKLKKVDVQNCKNLKRENIKSLDDVEVIDGQKQQETKK